MTSEGDTRARAAGPIQSMTGSGTASGTTELGAVTVECRTTNGRGLTFKTRLAGDCQGFEAALETYIRSRLQRGSVFAMMVIDESVGDKASAIDADAAVAVAKQLEALAKRLGTKVGLADVLAMPGVVLTQTRSVSRVSRELPDDIAALVRQAVDELIANREREGAATVDAMRDSIDRIEAELAAVTELAPEVVARYREKLLQRVNEFLEGRAKAMEDSDVIREVAVFADRIDIAEELQRLGSHMTKARELLQADGIIGRNLEFLVQEMLREVNTLGSKSPDVSIAHRVVEMKSCIDKLKEQAANLA